MTFVALSLNFLWEFLSPILSNSMKERLKPKGSAKTARDRAFHLYQVLGNVQNATNSLIRELEYFANIATNNTLWNELPKRVSRNIINQYAQLYIIKRHRHWVLLSTQHDDCPKLRWEKINQLDIKQLPIVHMAILTWAAGSLMDLLPQLVKALDDVNPQLEIHKHDLVRHVIGYCDHREDLLTELEEAAYDISQLGKERVIEVASQAKMNSHLISKSIDDMRSFLAEVFPFKESFD